MFKPGTPALNSMHDFNTGDGAIGHPYLTHGRAGAVVKINVKFLFASFFGWMSWTLFGIDSSFYGVVFMAAMFALVAFALSLGAVVQIAKLYLRERMIAAYIAQGMKPKTSKLAGNDALDKAGMR